MAKETEKAAEVQRKKNLVDSHTLSQLFGVTTRRIQQLAAAGVIPSTREKGGVNRYDLLSAVRCYIAYLQEVIESRERQRVGSPDEENESRKIKADADLKATKAELAAIELADLKNKMHRSEDVEAMTSDLLLHIQETIEELPQAAAKELAALSRPVEVADALRKRTNEMLNTLSKYEYSEASAARRRAAYDERKKALDGGVTPPEKPRRRK